MDDEGLDPEALERELKRGPKPAFLYTIPTFQNPSGRTLSVERRKRIVELAHEHDLLVLEDDPYGFVRYEGTAPPTMFEIEGSIAGPGRPYLLVLEDDLTGASRRLPDPAQAAAQAARADRLLDHHLALEPARGDGLRVRPARSLRAQPGADERPSPHAPRRDARRRWSGTSATAQAGAGRKAATSTGSTCPKASTPASCWRGRPRPASPSARAPTSIRTAAAPARSGSPTAPPRPRRSSAGSPSWPSWPGACRTPGGR